MSNDYENMVIEIDELREYKLDEKWIKFQKSKFESDDINAKKPRNSLQEEELEEGEDDNYFFEEKNKCKDNNVRLKHNYNVKNEQRCNEKREDYLSLCKKNENSSKKKGRPNSNRQPELTKKEKEALREKHRNILIELRNEHDVFCDICLGEESLEDDEIIICDLCNSACHQTCYGSELHSVVPNGDWYCQRCRQLITRNLTSMSIKCLYCPELMGIIKEITIQKTKEKIWAHVSCINWNPEIYFTDKRNEILEADQFDKSRKNKICKLCKIHYGYCLKCDEDSCKFSFHTTCAQQKGLILSYEIMEGNQGEGNGNAAKKIYCLAHMQEFHPELMPNVNMIMNRSDSNKISFKYDVDENQYEYNKIPARVVLVSGDMIVKEKSYAYPGGSMVKRKWTAKYSSGRQKKMLAMEENMKERIFNEKRKELEEKEKMLDEEIKMASSCIKAKELQIKETLLKIKEEELNLKNIRSELLDCQKKLNELVGEKQTLTQQMSPNQVGSPEAKQDSVEGKTKRKRLNKLPEEVSMEKSNKKLKPNHVEPNIQHSPSKTDSFQESNSLQEEPPMIEEMLNKEKKKLFPPQIQISMKNGKKSEKTVCEDQITVENEKEKFDYKLKKPTITLKTCETPMNPNNDKNSKVASTQGLEAKAQKENMNMSTIFHKIRESSKGKLSSKEAANNIKDSKFRGNQNETVTPTKEGLNQTREDTNQARETTNETREDTNQTRETTNLTREATIQTREATNQAREMNQTREARNQTREATNQTREAINPTNQTMKALKITREALNQTREPTNIEKPGSNNDSTKFSLFINKNGTFASKEPTNQYKDLAIPSSISNETIETNNEFSRPNNRSSPQTNQQKLSEMDQYQKIFGQKNHPQKNKNFNDNLSILVSNQNKRPLKRFSRKCEEVILTDKTMNWLVRMNHDYKVETYPQNSRIHIVAPCFDI